MLISARLFEKVNSVQFVKNTQLKDTILETAWSILEKNGEKAINIREIAKGSRCSLGSVYNSFENYDEIVLHLNARTIEMLYEEVRTRLDKKMNGGSLKEALLEIGRAYLDFSKKHPHLWRALFEVAAQEEMPSWYLKRVNAGFEDIADRVGNAFPERKEGIHRLITFLWALAHGISSITLNRKLQIIEEGVDEKYIEKYFSASLDGLLQ